MEMEMEVVEFRIHLHCRACEKAVRKAVCRIKGVEINATLKKMTVLGYMDRKVIIKALRKTGRRADAWVQSTSDDHPLPPPRTSGFIRCINLD